MSARRRIPTAGEDFSLGAKLLVRACVWITSTTGTSRGEEDTCENARRCPGREGLLIRDSARESRHYSRPCGRLVAALRRRRKRLWAPGSCEWGQTKRNSLRKSESRKRFQAAPTKKKKKKGGTLKGRGGEGAGENALLSVSGSSTFKLYRRVGGKRPQMHRSLNGR